MSEFVVLFVFSMLIFAIMQTVGGYKVFTFSRAELDETNRFSKISKSGICSASFSNQKLDLLIMVNSAVGNFAKRSAVRDTWGKVVREQGVPMLFLVGSTQNAYLQSRIEAEDRQYGDLMQTPVLDDYQNITLKTMVMLRFIALNCPQAKWGLKMDDDMLLHAKRIINFARTTTCPGAMFGRLAHAWEPIRNPTHKNSCPVECYPNKIYPDFLIGGTVLFDAKLAQRMYIHAMTHHNPGSVVEDVYMFGIVAQALNIKRIGFYGLDYDGRISPKDVCEFTKHFSTEQLNVRHFMNLWKKFNQNGEPICPSIPELNQLTKCP